MIGTVMSHQPPPPVPDSPSFLVVEKRYMNGEMYPQLHAPSIIVDGVPYWNREDTIKYGNAVEHGGRQHVTSTPKYSESDIRSMCRHVLSASEKVPLFRTPLSSELILSMIECIKFKASVEPTHLIGGSVFMQRFLSDRGMYSQFEPTLRHDEVILGFLGKLFGLDVIDEAYTLPPDQVLDRSSLYVAAFSEDRKSLLYAVGTIIT